MAVLVARMVFFFISLVGVGLMVESENLGKWAFIVGAVIWALFGIVCIFPQILLFTKLF